MNLAYTIVLALHNLTRWIALILGILVTVQAFLGWLGKREWTERDRKFGSFFGISMDTQMLLGLLLYLIFSPLTKAVLQNFSAAMKYADLRFFGLEHVLYMVLALVMAHLGSILPKKAETSLAKFQRAAILFALAILLIFLGMPWMRPLLPHF